MPTLASDHRRSQSPQLLTPSGCGPHVVFVVHTQTHTPADALSSACSGKCLPFDKNNNNSSSSSRRSMFSPIFAADLRTRVRTLGDARIRIRLRIRLQFEAWQNISIIYRLIPVKHLFRFFALSTWPTAASLVAIKSNLFVLFYVKTHGNTS